MAAKLILWRADIFTPRLKSRRGIVMITVPVSVCQHFTLFALQVAIQVGSLPNLAWWLFMGRGWCLLLDFPVRWSQLFRSTSFYLKKVFSYAFRKLDLNQTWYEWWRGFGDQPYSMTSWWRHHWLHGWLITDEELSIYWHLHVFFI